MGGFLVCRGRKGMAAPRIFGLRRLWGPRKNRDLFCPNNFTRFGTLAGYWKVCMTRKQQHEAGWVCPNCKLPRQEDWGVDPCFFEGPEGIDAACCGHGMTEGYILFSNGMRFGFVLTSLNHMDSLPEKELRTPWFKIRKMLNRMIWKRPKTAKKAIQEWSDETAKQS